MGTDETSSDSKTSSELQTIEEEDEVTSLKEEKLVPGGLKRTFSTPEIEEHGVESCDLSERGVKRTKFCIRRNKLIMIRELMQPNEMIRAFLSALSSGRLS
jgi:hypothetical protein